MNLKQQIGGRVRHIRNDRGLSLRALEAKSGVDRSVVGRAESGERDLSTTSLRRLCEALEVSADFLLGLTADPTPRNTTSQGTKT